MSAHQYIAIAGFDHAGRQIQRRAAQHLGDFGQCQIQFTQAFFFNFDGDLVIIHTPEYRALHFRQRLDLFVKLLAHLFASALIHRPGDRHAQCPTVIIHPLDRGFFQILGKIDNAVDAVFNH